MQLRQILRRIGRIGFLHCGDQQICGVIRERRIDDRVDVVLRLVRVEKILRRRHDRQARLRADQSFGIRFAGELLHRVGARAVAEAEYRLDPELARLLQHRTARCIHAAVEDGIGRFTLHLRQNGLEVSGLVVGLLARDDIHVRRLQRFLDFVREPFAVGSRVVDDRDLLDLHRLEILGDGGPLLVVSPDVAKDVFEALLGQLRVRRRARDHRDAGLAVDGGGRNRDAGIQVPDDARDFRVRKFLRDRGPELRIRLVVLALQHEMNGLAADLHFLGVGLLDREARAVFVVLAEVRDAACQRTCMTNFDGDRVVGGRLRCFGGFLRLFLLTAAVNRDQRSADEDEAELLCEVHLDFLRTGKGKRMIIGTQGTGVNAPGRRDRRGDFAARRASNAAPRRCPPRFVAPLAAFMSARLGFGVRANPVLALTASNLCSDGARTTRGHVIARVGRGTKRRADSGEVVHGTRIDTTPYGRRADRNRDRHRHRRRRRAPRGQKSPGRQ